MQEMSTLLDWRLYETVFQIVKLKNKPEAPVSKSTDGLSIHIIWFI